MKNIEQIYQHHHQSRSREGFAVLEEERGEIFASLIGKGKKVLDLGCRDGVITKYFVEGNEITGADIDSQALEIVKEKLGIKTIHLDLQDPEWPIDESYDVVVIAEVLEHLYFPEKVLNKISYLLKPNGKIIGSVPNAFALKNKLRYFFNSKKGTPLEDPMHINQFSWSELEELLSNYFSDVKLYPLGRKFGGLSYLLSGSLSYAIAFSGVKK